MKECIGENPQVVLEKQLFNSTFNDPLMLGFVSIKALSGEEI